MPVASSWTEIKAFDAVEHAVNDTLQHLLDRMDNELQKGSGFVYRAILHLDINVSDKSLDSESDAAKETSRACDTPLTAQISQSKFGHNDEFDISPFFRVLKDKKTSSWTSKTVRIAVSYLPSQQLFFLTTSRPYR